MRLVLDTNVWVSAILNPSGSPGQLVEAALEARFEVPLTEHLWNEILQTMSKERIQKALTKKGRWNEALVLLVRMHSRVTAVEDVPPLGDWLPEDPADNWVIQCALTGKAEMIVTGDGPLLGLRAVESVRIVRVRDALLELGIVVE